MAAVRNIQNVVDFFSYIVRKERGVFLTISEAITNIDNGQLDCFEEYWSMYAVSQTVHDALRPFRVYQPFTSNSAGFVTYPSDYIHMAGVPFVVYGSTIYNVNFPNEDEWVDALTSQLRPVSASNPIAQNTATGFSLYPQQSHIGFYTYMKRPPQPVYAYTEVGRVITYNSSASTQLAWNEIYWNNIIAKGLKYCGINMSEQEVSQFAQQYNQETAGK
jgi:hypothetical protein